MKKIRKIIVISMLILILTGLLAQNTYAAMEVKAGTTTKVDITVSNSFAYCYNLRASSTTLGNNTLDPHLTLNSDWGAVAYLAASVYGTNRVSEADSTSSTTGNESGVKDFGKNHTQTSSLYGGSGTNYTANLTANINTKYVENLSTSNSISTTRGQAFAETSSFASRYYTYPSASYPVGIRIDAFGIHYASEPYPAYSTGQGASKSTVTFRPVIWN